MTDIISGIILTIPATIVTSVVYGWALTVMWGWFMVPIFRLPRLRVAQAIGVAATVGLFTLNLSGPGPKEEPSLTIMVIKNTILGMVLPLTIVVFGWFVKKFV